MEHPGPPGQPEFSLIRGGLWYRIELGLRLLRPESLRAGQRAIFYALLSWMPLAVLSALSGDALDSGIHHGRVPFFEDIAIHVRLLIALPALVLTEAVVDRGTGLLVGHFRNVGIVAPTGRDRFEEAVRGTVRLRDSWIAEVVIFGLAFASSWARVHGVARGTEAWIVVAGSQSQLAPAGWWLGLVAQPIFVACLLRLIWRYYLWAHFQWKVSRCPLDLSPAHPDRVGGLGLLKYGQRSFTGLFFAVSAVLSGSIANRMVHEGANLLDFKMTVGSLGVCAILIYAAPLLVFFPPLARTKWQGLMKYDRFAGEYTQAFDRKWLGPAKGEPRSEHSDQALGSGDIQSLADLGNAFERVEGMKFVPMDPGTAIRPALAVALPMLPLVLMIMPLGELLKLLMKALM